MAKEDKKSVEVVETQNTALAQFMGDMESMAGAGGENVQQDDMSIPFIKIAQALSPEVDEEDPGYIEGLKPGMFFFTATKQIVGDGSNFDFVPCLYRRAYIEWVPRDSGSGGFVAEHSELPTSAEDDGKGGFTMPNGNIIIVTATWYGLALTTDGMEQCVISLASTQFKKSRLLTSLLKKVRVAKKDGTGSFNPPFFYNVVRATTVREQNDHGKWSGWKFDLSGNITTLDQADQVFAFAQDTYEAVRSGTVKANHSVDTPQGASDNTSTSGTTRSAGMKDMEDEEIPF